MTVVTEARQAKRRRVVDMALIRVGDISVSCIIRDLTDAGAALDLQPPYVVPDRFTLIALATKKSIHVPLNGGRNVELACHFVDG
jgi:hypothetical protein